MRHEDRIGQSAWDYGTVVIIMIATFAVSPGNARVYGEELLSAPVAGTILDRFTLTGDWWGVRDTLSAHGIAFDQAVKEYSENEAKQLWQKPSKQLQRQP